LIAVKAARWAHGMFTAQLERDGKRDV